MQHDPDVGLLHAHHVVGDFRPARLAEDRSHFGKFQQQLLDLRATWSSAPSSVALGKPIGFDQDVSFVQPRHELGPESQARWEC